MLECCVPVATDVTLERLSEDGVELHDVLLETDNVAIQREHVVDALVLEVLDIDCLILLEFDEIANLMFVTDSARLSILERHIKGVDADRLLLTLQTLIDKSVHRDHINLSKRVTSL